MKKILSIALLLVMLILMASCTKNENVATRKYEGGVLQYVTLPDYKAFKITVNMDAIQMAIDNYILQTATDYKIQYDDDVYMDFTIYSVKYIEIEDDGRTITIDQEDEELTELKKEDFLIKNFGTGTYWLQLEQHLVGTLEIGASTREKLTIPNDFYAEKYRGYEVYIDCTFKGITARRGDVAQVEYTGYYLDETGNYIYEDGEKKSFDSGKSSFYLGSHLAIEDFENGIIGMKVGETKEIEATFPEDYGVEDLNGKKVIFECTLKSIKLPAIYNDDFAKQYGYDTTNEFEEHLIEQEWKNSALTDIIDSTVVNSYPLRDYIRVTIQTIKEAAPVDKQYASQGITFDDYLAVYMGLTREEYIKLQMKSEMTYYAIAENENMTVSSEEIVAEKKELINYYQGLYMKDYKLDEQDALVAATRYVNEFLGDYGVEEMVLFDKVREHIYKNIVPEIEPRTYDSVTLEKAEKNK